MSGAPVVIRLGLTGGIGSGKSTVASMLSQRGAALIDADAISRASTAAGGAAIPMIAHHFGADFLTPQGALDRDRMRQKVFSEPSARAQLEAIVHPIVGQHIAEQVQAAKLAGHRCIVLDIPLLVESAHWRASLDRVLVVDCSEATQCQRVMQRNGLREDEVQRIIASQAPRARRLAAADLVVCNDGIGLDTLNEQVGWIGARFGL